MKLFTKFNEEMFFEVKRNDKFSKKQISIFYEDLIQNLPAAIDIKPIEKEKFLSKKVFKISSILESIDTGRFEHAYFTGLQKVDIIFFVNLSSSLEELESKIIDFMKQEKQNGNLTLFSYAMLLPDYIKERVDLNDFFEKIKLLFKNKKIIFLYENGDKKIFSKRKSAKELSFTHCTFDLAQSYLNSIHEKDLKLESWSHPIKKVLDEKNNIVFEFV